MRLNLHLFGAAGLIFSLAACSTASKTPVEDGDLDVAMEARARPPLAPRIKANKDDAPLKVPATAATNWQAFFKQPPTQKERSLLERRLEKWPDTGSAKDMLKKARAELAIGRLASAETSLRQALRRESDNLEASLDLASLYLRMKRFGDTFDLLAQAKETISTSDNVSQSLIFKYRYTLALAYVARGERDKGHKVLSDLIALDKTFTPAYASLASSYLAVGRDTVAEFVVRRGLDRVHDSASLLNLLGVIAQKANQFETARGWFDKSLQASPTFSPALVNRAILSMSNLEYGAAEEDLLQALAIDPQNVDALVALGIVQKRQGNFTGARASLTKGVDLDPDNAYARFNLGVLLADELKKPNEAVRLFHEVLQTTTVNPELKDLARNYINDLQPLGPRY